MTFTTIAGAADIVSDTLQDAIADYEAFYAQVNDYEEPQRVTAADVLAVRNVVRESLAVPLSQLQYSPQGLSGLEEGRTFKLGMSPGVISCRSTDLAHTEKTLGDGVYGTGGLVPGNWFHEEYNEATLSKRSLLVDAGIRIDPETGELEEDEEPGPSQAEITEWSRKSRAQMSRTLASLDYSTWTREGGALAMVTTTLPGDWKPVAPNGREFKKTIAKFRRRWERAIGPWVCLWKMEFQRRGAPHFHALMRVPALVSFDGGYPSRLGYGKFTVTFEDWLSFTWADVVNASRDIDTIGQWVRVGDGFEILEDGTESSEWSRHLAAGTGVDFSGKDFSDPRRIALYFAGHSAKSQDGKEYQHKVPARWRRPGDGPGRFWGFCGLVNAFEELEVTQRDYDRLRRELRKLARARSWEIALKRRRGYAFRDALERKEDAAAAAAAVDAFQVRAPRLRRSMYGGGGGQNGGWVLLNDALEVVRGLGAWMAGTAECRPGCTWCGHVEPSAA